MKKLSLKINSDTENVELVTECVRALCLFTSLSQASVDGVQLAVTEAVNNVILHSYKGESSHPIWLTISLQDEYLTMSLSDTGVGMEPILLQADRSSVTEIEPDDVMRLDEGGRGLFLIKATMDKVNYHSDGGTHTLQMTKYFD
ncbi:MAG: ATP-binding protein [Pseudomonadota bacterium]